MAKNPNNENSKIISCCTPGLKCKQKFNFSKNESASNKQSRAENV